MTNFDLRAQSPLPLEQSRRQSHSTQHSANLRLHRRVHLARGLIHDDEWVGDWTVDPHEKFADLLLDLALHGPPADVAKADSPETRPADGY